MSDVSNLVLMTIDEGLSRDGVDFDDLLEGLPISAAEVRSSRLGRVSWETLFTISERLCDHVGGLEKLEAFSASTFKYAPGILLGLATRYVKPHTLFYIGVRWFGPSLLRGAHATIKPMPGGLIESVTLPESCRECPSFYHLTAGYVRMAPTLVNWPPAEIQLTYSGNRVEYRIRLRSPGAQEVEAVDHPDVLEERLVASSHLDEMLGMQNAEAEPGRRAGSTASRMHADSEALSRRVRALFGRSQRFDWTAKEVARELGMSERSLGRGLAREEASFKQLRDEIRLEVAIAWLQENRRIEEIAGHLGFADASSFHRAFRRWTNRSPRTYLKSG